MNKSIQQAWVENFLTELSDDDLLRIYNDWASNNDPDDEIFSNDEDFFETYFSGKIMDAMRAVSFGEYNFNDDYVKFNGYANLETFNTISDHVDISDLAGWILDNDKMSEYDMDYFEEDMQKEFISYAEEQEEWEEVVVEDFFQENSVTWTDDFDDILKELKEWYDNKKAEAAEKEEGN